MMKRSVIGLFVVGIFAMVFIAGCTSIKDTPITNITVPGQNIIYSFNSDIRQSILVKSDDEGAIRGLFYNESLMTFVFNGTSPTDNSMFYVAAYDTVQKIPTYLAYQGHSLQVDKYYFLDAGGPDGVVWYNSTGDNITKPDMQGIVLWLKGPQTGANETSVGLAGKTITIQGMSAKNLSMAADKLALVVFGITDLSQIKTG